MAASLPLTFPRDPQPGSPQGKKCEKTCKEKPEVDLICWIMLDGLLFFGNDFLAFARRIEATI